MLLRPTQNFDGNVQIVGWAGRDWLASSLLASVSIRIGRVNGKNDRTRQALTPPELPSLLSLADGFPNPSRTRNGYGVPRPCDSTGVCVQPASVTGIFRGSDLAHRGLWLEQEPLVIDDRIASALEAML